MRATPPALVDPAVARRAAALLRRAASADVVERHAPGAAARAARGPARCARQRRRRAGRPRARRSHQDVDRNSTSTTPRSRARPGPRAPTLSDRARCRRRSSRTSMRPVLPCVGHDACACAAAPCSSGSPTGSSGAAASSRANSTSQSPPMPSRRREVEPVRVQAAAVPRAVVRQVGRDQPVEVDAARIDEHQPRPRTASVARVALQVAREQQHERQHEVEDDQQPAPGTASRPASALEVPGDLLGQVARPDDQELREGDVGPEHDEGEHAACRGRARAPGVSTARERRLAADSSATQHDHEGERREHLADHEQHAVDRREPVRLERHHPVDRRERDGEADQQQPAAAQALAAPRDASRSSRRASCSRDHLRQEVREHDPDGEVERGARQEERHVQVGRLLLQERVGGDGVRAAPSRRCAAARARCGRKSSASSGSVRAPASSRRRITRPHSAAGEVVDAAMIARQPSATPIQKRKATRYERKNCAGVHERAERAQRARPTRRRRSGRAAGARSQRRAWRCRSSAQCGSSCAGAAPAARRARRACAGGTSSSVAFWLSCSART